MKHRFGRMESHLTSLAKTVAQISLELRSMRGIEDIIYTLSQDIQHLKVMHLASNGNGGSIAAGFDTPTAAALLSNLHVNRTNNEGDVTDMLQQQQQQRRRSSSEPMLLDQIVANSQRLQMATASSLTKEERENVERRPVNKVWERMLHKRANSRPSPSLSHGGNTGNGGELEMFRASAYANPRKLKKLTK